jgi:hypothetical protein
MDASSIPDLFFSEQDTSGIEQVVGDFLLRMRRTHGRAARERTASKIFDEEASRLGLLPDQALSSNELDALVSGVSARLTTHHFRMPTSRRLKAALSSRTPHVTPASPCDTCDKADT